MTNMKHYLKMPSLAFLVTVGMLLVLVAAGRGTADTGRTDERLLGKWARVTDVVAEGITLRPDGTFEIRDISYYRMFHTVWRNVTVGHYRVEGDKIIFYDQKISTTSKAGVVQYTMGDYEILKEQEKVNRVNEPIKDEARAFKIVGPDKVIFGDAEFKRYK